MDGPKIAHAAGVRRRPLQAALWIAFAVSLIAGFAIQLWINYRPGAIMLNTHNTEWYASLFFQEHIAVLLTLLDALWGIPVPYVPFN